MRTWVRLGTVTILTLAALAAASCGPKVQTTPTPAATPAPAPGPAARVPTPEPAQPVPVVTPAVPVAPVISTRLDVDAGSVPPAGWKWVVSEINIGTDPNAVPSTPTSHDYTHVFYVVKGSTQVGADNVTKTVPEGEAALVPAHQEHSHLYPPQSKVLAVHLRAADDPPGAKPHGGDKILLSDKPLVLETVSSLKLRVREFTLSPKSRTSDLTKYANFGYVLQGTLAIVTDNDTIPVEANKVFTLPLGGKIEARNQVGTLLRFILVDVHP